MDTMKNALSKMLDGEGLLLFDGAMGSQLMKAGIALVGASTNATLCMSHAAEVSAIHRAYLDAGAQVITSNTFCANARTLGDAATVAKVYAAALSCARAAGADLVAGDVGPLGEMLEPYGDLEEDEAYELFAEQMRAIRDARDAEGRGFDLVLIETMADLNEAKIAVQAAHDICDLPVFATMSFDASGHTYMGVTAQAAATELSEAGVSALGVNCSVGPDALVAVISSLKEHASCPIIAQPNAGLPHIEQGVTCYDVTPNDFAQSMTALLDAGAQIVGGCCGTTPEHIAALAAIANARR